MSITTRAAVLLEGGSPYQITELELDDPKANEVLVRVHAAGLCHSDYHVRTGDSPMRMPVVGGHEGAGVVEAVGPGTTRVKVGDHVVFSFIPVCGQCRYCSTGRQNLCDAGKNAGTGEFLDGTFRFHKDGVDYGAMCVLGTFTERVVVMEYSVVPVPKEIPFEVAALVGCGVPTGWGSSVYAGNVRAGQNVVVFGAGGVGMNAVQGAAGAGAQRVVVVDPVAFKREKAREFGATHTFATAAEAQEFIVADTWGELADVAVVTVGFLQDEVIHEAIQIVGKNGTVVLTAIGPGHVRENSLLGYQKRIQGAIFGACNPLADIPKLLRMYQNGRLKLDELITARYSLEDVNQGYQDMEDGKNIRGVLIIEH